MASNNEKLIFFRIFEVFGVFWGGEGGLVGKGEK